MSGSGFDNREEPLSGCDWVLREPTLVFRRPSDVLDAVGQGGKSRLTASIAESVE